MPRQDLERNVRFQVRIFFQFKVKSKLEVGFIFVYNCRHVYTNTLNKAYEFNDA